MLRFGWVIVDGEKRGHGIGREMLKLGLKQAFEVMGAREVTLGVYENNVGAYKCYRSAGFHGPSEIEDHVEKVDGEERKVIELEITREEWANRAR